MLGNVWCSLVCCVTEKLSSAWINRSLVSLWANPGFLIVGYSVRLSQFWPIIFWALRLSVEERGSNEQKNLLKLTLEVNTWRRIARHGTPRHIKGKQLTLFQRLLFSHTGNLQIQNLISSIVSDLGKLETN